MRIRITYKVRDESEKYLDFMPEEYFDPVDEDENETFEEDGIPKFNHANEYLDILTENLQWTEIEITETNNGRNIKTQYFDNGKSWMSRRKDFDGYEEIIISSQLNGSDVHIVRIHKEHENWQVNYDGVITDLADGSQTERKIF